MDAMARTRRFSETNRSHRGVAGAEWSCFRGRKRLTIAFILDIHDEATLKHKAREKTTMYWIMYDVMTYSRIHESQYQSL